MSADDLISRLQKVRDTGRGRWMACCPAHQDKRPSMTIREMDDGRVLMHCFAGCEVGDILAAVGLEFDALFPEKPIESAKSVRRPFNPQDILAAVADETQVVMMIALRVKTDPPITAEERERLLLAHERLQTARQIANGD